MLVVLRVVPETLVGEELVVLGDTNPGTAGIALVPAQLLTSLLELAGQVQEETEKREDGQ